MFYKLTEWKPEKDVESKVEDVYLVYETNELGTISSLGDQAAIDEPKDDPKDEPTNNTEEPKGELKDTDTPTTPTTDDEQPTTPTVQGT